MTLRIEDLGRRPYAEVLDLQRHLRARRITGELAEDVVLLVEHPPVITLGRGTRPSSLPIAPAELERRGVEVFEVERGGDVTFHGPGQLVGYPILDLHGHRQDLHWYLRSLEDVLIQALGPLGIEADRNPGLTGVWTAGRKIASIGVHVKQWVTLHGFALNVTNDLDPFDLIVPCGIQQVVMTSVAEELLRRDSDALMTEVRARVVSALEGVFGVAAHFFSVSDPVTEPRLPPGQIVTRKWPVLHYGTVPIVDLGRWRFTVRGAVERPFEMGWEELQSLPRRDTACDIHCVTRWSRYDNVFGGVPVRDLLARAGVAPEGRFVLVHAEQGYTTNLPLEDLDRPENLLALTHNGEPLTPEHGGPVRLLVPHLYFWKSAKWVKGFEVMEEDYPGFWEQNGYHMRGDPWREERFGRPDPVRMRRGPR